ncbi:MAG: outer membrane beta-barrel protein [Candidatus Protistobacter heckmanni]|nr:outer membrane beta-barrel protein [Candidatus Protistobacter heckmanni]
MKALQASTAASLAALLLGLASAAAAAAPGGNDKGWYGLGAAGASNGTLDGGVPTGQETGSNFNSYGLKLGLDYSFNCYFAIEGAGVMLGKSKMSMFRPGTSGSGNAERSINGVSLSMLGMLPVTDNWRLFTKVGAAYTRTTLSSSSSTPGIPVPAGATSKKTPWMLGLGVEYALSNATSLRFELERY